MGKPKEYTIEKDVPMPHHANRGKRKTPIIPLSKMEVGDSVFIAGPLSRTALTNRLSIARKQQFTEEQNKQVKLRSAVERNGYRVWRVR